MQHSALSLAKTEASLLTAQLEQCAVGWLLDGEIRQHSPTTLAIRRIVVNKLLWFLRKRDYAQCGTLELRQFLAYVTNGHKEPGGRWGAASEPSYNPAQAGQQQKPVRPRTVHTYHGHLRTFFRWLVAEGVLYASPMERIAAPIARTDQIQPFTPQQVTLLLQAAKRSEQPRRNEALLLFLFDTGLRASELCALRMKDVDLSGRRCTVLGKGNKHRSVPFGGTATKALWQYLREDPHDPEDPLFFSKRGDPLTRSGLLQLVRHLGKAARIEVARCSPHTFRHTFAVEFLRAGGNVFTLQQLLGHTSLTMTNRYVALAQADIEAQHRQFSPADRLKGRNR